MIRTREIIIILAFLSTHSFKSRYLASNLLELSIIYLANYDLSSIWNKRSLRIFKYIWIMFIKNILVSKHSGEPNTNTNGDMLLQPKTDLLLSFLIWIALEIVCQRLKEWILNIRRNVFEGNEWPTLANRVHYLIWGFFLEHANFTSLLYLISFKWQ